MFSSYGYSIDEFLFMCLFFGFGLLCRHTASNPITAEMHTSGAQYGRKRLREIECLLNHNHQKGKMMIMIMKTSESQVDSPVAEGKRKEGGGRKIRDLHRDT